VQEVRAQELVEEEEEEEEPEAMPAPPTTSQMMDSIAIMRNDLSRHEGTDAMMDSILTVEDFTNKNAFKSLKQTNMLSFLTTPHSSFVTTEEQEEQVTRL
jgi:hypothetical protein